MISKDRSIQNYLRVNFDYSDFQIGQIKYTVTSILSEVSKMILMGIFFAFTDHLVLYIYAVAVLLSLRTCTGGLHMKHYISCFLVSFALLYCGIILLPMISLARPIYFVGLLLCICINEYCAPVVSSYRPTPDGFRIKKAKKQALIVITAYALIMHVCPLNSYMITGFWMICLQSFQLLIAKVIRKGANIYEKTI